MIELNEAFGPLWQVEVSLFDEQALGDKNVVGSDVATEHVLGQHVLAKRIRILDPEAGHHRLPFVWVRERFGILFDHD